MKQNILNWSSLSWEHFQRVCVDIADTVFSGYSFVEYLKKGNNQQGIDLITTIKDGKYLVIQCKHENQTPASIDKIIKKFLEGKFGNQSSHFVLATTADFQTEAMQTHLEGIKDRLKKQGITFEPWDVNFIEGKLKHQFTWVAYYFNLQSAQTFCSERIKTPTQIKDEFGDKYIHRKVLAFNSSAIPGTPSWYAKAHSSEILISFLERERISAKRICLLGDPYQGKTALLNRTAYEAGLLSIPFMPIMIELKKTNIRPIEEILNLNGEWKIVPLGDLIIFIDGLDEVPSNKFRECITHIYEFSQAYPRLNIVVSCRKLFYFLFSLETRLREFDFFELKELGHQDVKKHVGSFLKNKSESFFTKASQLSLETLLTEPFYLTELLKSYTEPPFKMLDSKSAIIENFIKKTIDGAAGRPMSNGSDFKHIQHAYRVVIQKFAFALQLSGLNAMPEDSVTQLFTALELEMLQHSGLLTVNSFQWSFTSALFQEFLCARILTKLDYDHVASLTTLGKQRVKIKAKWMQTFLTLVSMASHENGLATKYLHLLNQDNIELIFQTDRTKYNETLRTDALNLLLDRADKKNIGPMHVYEWRIAAFIDSDKSAREELISRLSAKKSSYSVKILCVNLLSCLPLSTQEQERLCEIILKGIPLIANHYYAAKCVDLLGQCNHYNEKTARQLTSLKKLNEEHTYRDAVYRYLHKTSLADVCYEYGLEGTSILFAYNREINHVGSEDELIRFLTSTNELKNLEALLKQIISENWTNFLEYRSIERRTIFTALVTAGVRVYKKNTAIVFSFCEFIIKLKNKQRLEEFSELDNFFEMTGTRSIAAMMFTQEIFNGNGFQYGCFFDKKDLPMLFYEMEEKGSSIARLGPMVNSLHNAGKTDLAVYLSEICDELWEIEFPDHDDGAIRRWEIFELLKQENDGKYFKSAHVFAKAVKALFAYYKTKNLSKKHFFITEDAPDKLKKIASHLMFNFLLKWATHNGEANLDSCLQLLGNEKNFEKFKVYEAFDLATNDRVSASMYKAFLEEYYRNEIKDARFSNCYFVSEGKMMQKRNEIFLFQIYWRYAFDTPYEILFEMLWADREGANSLKESGGNGRKSFSLELVEKMDSHHIQDLQSAVSAHLHSGIENDNVFATHAAFAEYFMMDDVNNLILKRINKPSVPTFDIPYLGRIYLALNGTPESLMPILEKLKYENHYILTLLKFLQPYKPTGLELFLEQYLSDKKITDENRVAVARMLASLGNSMGFSFLVQYIADLKSIPNSIQSSMDITTIDTSFALNQLYKISSHLMDDIRGMPRETPKEILLEWLFQFALKSEDDLQLVLAFFEKVRVQFKKHPNSKDCFYYTERCIDRFRETGIDKFDLSHIAGELAQIPQRGFDLI